MPEKEQAPPSPEEAHKTAIIKAITVYTTKPPKCKPVEQRRFWRCRR